MRVAMVQTWPAGSMIQPRRSPQNWFFTGIRIFARAENGMLYATGSRRLAAGGFCASQDADVHQMSNLQPSGCELITFHIYSPALVSMNMDSIVDAKVTRFFDPINDEFVSGAGI
jgi:hypothetical protein